MGRICRYYRTELESFAASAPLCGAGPLVLLRPIETPHRCAHEPIPHTRLAREVEPGVVFGPRVEHFSELDVLETRGLQPASQFEGVVEFLPVGAFREEPRDEIVTAGPDQAAHTL